MELLNDNANKKKLIDTYTNKICEDPTGKKIIEKYSHRSLSNNKSKYDDIIIAPVTSAHRWEATFSQQVLILIERTFKQSRQVILSKIDLIQSLSLALVCSLVWYRMPFEEVNVPDRVGCVSINVAPFNLFIFFGLISN